MIHCGPTGANAAQRALTLKTELPATVADAAADIFFLLILLRLTRRDRNLACDHPKSRSRGWPRLTVTATKESDRTACEA